jgi:hypothetical protein
MFIILDSKSRFISVYKYLQVLLVTIKKNSTKCRSIKCFFMTLLNVGIDFIKDSLESDTIISCTLVQ